MPCLVSCSVYSCKVDPGEGEAGSRRSGCNPYPPEFCGAVRRPYASLGYSASYHTISASTEASRASWYAAFAATSTSLVVISPLVAFRLSKNKLVKEKRREVRVRTAGELLTVPNPHHPCPECRRQDTARIFYASMTQKRIKQGMKLMPFASFWSFVCGGYWDVSSFVEGHCWSVFPLRNISFRVVLTVSDSGAYLRTHLPSINTATCMPFHCPPNSLILYGIALREGMSKLSYMYYERQNRDPTTSLIHFAP